MKKSTKIWLLTGGALGTAGLSTGIASLVLFRKTMPRPGEPSPDIVDEFADREKMEEYTVRMAPVGVRIRPINW